MPPSIQQRHETRGRRRGRLALPARAAVIACAALTGCEGDADRAARDRTIVLASPFGDAFSAAVEEVAARYVKTHPDVIVNVLDRPLRGYDTWVETQLVAGRPPDIFFSHAANENRKRDLVISLDDWLDRPNPYTGRTWRDAFVPGILLRYADEVNRVNMIPGDVRGYGFYYNKSIFAEAGVEPPRTWSQLLTACRALKAADVIPLACAGRGEARDFAWFIWGVRGLQDMLLRHLQDDLVRYKRDADWRMDLSDPWNDVGVRIALEDIMLAHVRGPFDPLRNPDWGAACRLLKELVPFYPPGFTGLTMREAKGLFISGRAAMIYLDTAFAYELNAALAELADTDRAFAVGLFPWPALTTASVDRPRLSPPRGQIEAGQKWNVARTTTQREARAVDFLRFLLTPEHVELVQLRVPAPNLPSIAAAEARPGVAAFREAWLGHGISAMHWMSTSFDPEAEARFIRQMQLYLLGEITLDQLMQRAHAEIVPTFQRAARQLDLDVGWVAGELEAAGEQVPAWLLQLRAERGAAPQAVTARPAAR